MPADEPSRAADDYLCSSAHLASSLFSHCHPVPSFAPLTGIENRLESIRDGGDVEILFRVAARPPAELGSQVSVGEEATLRRR